MDGPTASEVTIFSSMLPQNENLKWRIVFIALLAFIGLLMIVLHASTAIISIANDGYSIVYRPNNPLMPMPGSILKAFLVGSLGASGFYLGVRAGFISRDTRRSILYFMTWQIALFFCLFGGVVAAVFQAAQPDTFAPIQAFVLGATWPTVVARMMAGSDNSQSAASLVNKSAEEIPTLSTEKTAADAQRVIRKT